MLSILKNFGRKVIPPKLFRFLQPYYHGTIALLAHWYFGRPSHKLTVIGITGSAGKSTTVNALAHILNTNGKRSGVITTTNFFDGQSDYINHHGLSMPGGWLLQRQLSTMANRGCKYAIIECTSEGLAQNRHLGIKFFGALLTNLSETHLDAHGGFEHYRQAKGKLFKKYPVLLGLNLDDSQQTFFASFAAKRKFGITLENSLSATPKMKVYKATVAAMEPQLLFSLDGVNFQVDLIGKFNVYNTLLATACANELGVELEQIALALKTFKSVPGRMQEIETNQNFRVFVDYAPEPVAMRAALEAINRLPHHKIIHVFGSTGGHRDVAKRFEFGNISSQLSDVIIITNDDVYETSPELIAQNIEEGIQQAGQKKVSEILTILDRRSAIRRALSIARDNDIIIATGKGSEQFLVLPGNQRVSWDEPSIVREELTKLFT